MTKLTPTQLTDLGLIGIRSAKKHKGVFTEAEDKANKRKHEEADLHLAFCKWVAKEYPALTFIRHERERSRTQFTGQLMGIYNSLGGIPDWECLNAIGGHHGLYIEFKKPNEKWLDKHGVVKKEYAHQYKAHLKLWDLGKCAYFCNDLLTAQIILKYYIWQTPVPKQLYELPVL